MAKQLLTTKQTAQRLGISRANFYRIRAKLIAKGLKTTRIGSSTKYLESSLDKLIDRAINADRPLV
jgi:predicted DNA-binding transcriptional regulator AlpA